MTRKILALLLAVFAGIMVVRTQSFPSKQVTMIKAAGIKLQ